MMPDATSILGPANKEMIVKLHPLFENRVSLRPGRGHNLTRDGIYKLAFERFIPVRVAR